MTNLILWAPDILAKAICACMSSSHESQLESLAFAGRKLAHLAPFRRVQSARTATVLRCEEICASAQAQEVTNEVVQIFRKSRPPSHKGLDCLLWQRNWMRLDQGTLRIYAHESSYSKILEEKKER
jgi:hypothetical protein